MVTGGRGGGGAGQTDLCVFIAWAGGDEYCARLSPLRHYYRYSIQMWAVGILSMMRWWRLAGGRQRVWVGGATGVGGGAQLMVGCGRMNYDRRGFNRDIFWRKLAGVDLHHIFISPPHRALIIRAIQYTRAGAI